MPHQRGLRNKKNHTTSKRFIPKQKTTSFDYDSRLTGFSFSKIPNKAISTFGHPHSIAATTTSRPFHFSYLSPSPEVEALSPPPSPPPTSVAVTFLVAVITVGSLVHANLPLTLRERKMARRLSKAASTLLNRNSVVGRLVVSSLHQCSGTGPVIGKHIISDKPLAVNGEVVWDNGTAFPEPCIDRIADTVGKGQDTVKANDMGKGSRIDNNFMVGQKISGREKINFLIKTLLDLGDGKDVVYGTLDAWVAWERNFPIAALKNVLLALEREQQWHRIVQVIKWMLSKGQGNTVGTYQQLIRALDMDHRAEEAHSLWMKKIGNDLHSVPWQTCRLMISVYYRNNMLNHLIKLFKGLEAFDRKPPEKSIVQKVTDAYGLLGMVEEKEKLLQKYADLFSKSQKDSNKKSKRVKSKKEHASRTGISL